MRAKLGDYEVEIRTYKGDSPSTRLNDAVANVRETPGFRIQAAMQGVGDTINVLVLSVRELFYILDRITEEALHVEDLTEHSTVGSLRDYASLRFLSVLFVAAALVDHDRVFVNSEYVNASVRKAHEDRTRRFRDQGSLKAVQDLRNYAAHLRLPVIDVKRTHTVTDEGETVVIDIGFDTSDLVEWEGWKRVSRDWIEEIQFLSLRPWIEQYLKEVTELYGKLFADIREDRASELTDLDAALDEQDQIVEQLRNMGYPIKGIRIR